MNVHRQLLQIHGSSATRKAWVGLLVSLLAAACGGKADPGLAPIAPVELNGHAQKSGSRLKALAWMSEQGPTLQTRRFFDVQRDEECSFAVADDGSYRCFPGTALSQLLRQLQDSVEFFADSRCTDPVYPASPPASSGRDALLRRYVSVSGEDGCGSGTRIYGVGEIYNGSVYMNFPDGQCSESPMITDAVHYRRSHRIPNSEFVRASASLSAGRDGVLAPRQLNGEDGSGVLFGFFDLKNDGACDYSGDESNAFCRPSLLAVASNWGTIVAADGTPCRELVAQSDDCSHPRFGRGRDTPSIQRVVPEADLDHPTDALASCFEALQPYKKGPLYALTDEVPPSAFPVLQRVVVEKGLLSTYLQASEHGNLTLPYVYSAIWWTAKPEQFCGLGTAADGLVRCLPNATKSRYFADLECSIPLAIGSLTFEGRAVVAIGDSNGWTHIHEAGEKFEGVPYELSPDGACTVTSVPIALWYPGEELGTEGFPRYESVREP